MSSKKKEQIIAAARECFTRYGYKKTTLEDIGKKIGLNKASIYYYFKNKEEIFTNIILDEFQKFITKLHEDIEDNMDCEHKILYYFEQKLKHYQKSLLLLQVTEMNIDTLQNLISSGKEVIEDIEQNEKKFLKTILKQCIHAEQIKDCDIGKISEFLIGLVNGIKHSHQGYEINFPTTEDYEKIFKDVQSALKIFLHGLK